MKNILTYFIFIFSMNIYSQGSKISGNISLTNSDYTYEDLTILLVLKDSVITGATLKKNGYFEMLKKVDDDNYDLKITTNGNRDFVIQNILIANGDDLNLEILYPGECKYIKMKKPKCTQNHFDNIIPIVYGFPDKKMMKKYKQEKIFLGGCNITGCDPNYYCKTHKIEF